MSYYILPKKNTNITFDPVFLASEDKSHSIVPYISFSLFNYLNTIQNNLDKIINNDSSSSKTTNKEYKDYSINYLIKIVNTYEFLYFKIPEFNLTISKLKQNSNTFYIYMEIIQIFDLFCIVSNH